MFSSNSLCKHKNIFFFSFLLFFFTHSSLNAATLIYDGNFDSGKLGGLSCSGNCPKVSSAQKRSGNRSADFTLTRNLRTPYRTEAVFGEKGRFAFGKDYWITFNYRYENWDKDKSKEFAPFQIHTTQSNWKKECKVTRGAAASAPFFMASGDDKVRFATYKNKTLWSGSIQKRQWLKMVVHFKISTGNDGFIEAWKDGVKLGRVNGANSPKSDGCGKPMREPYLKVGVYKWDWKKGLKATGSTRRQLFIDDLKIATGSNGNSFASSSSNKDAQKAAPTKVTKKQPKPTKVAKTAPRATNNKQTVTELTAGKGVASQPSGAGTNTAIRDGGGKELTGTPKNGAQLTTAGIKFDGKDDYVDVGKQNVSGNAMTITGWFLAKNLSNCTANACRIISKSAGTGEQDHDFMISTIKVGSKTRLRFRLKTNGVTSTLIATAGNVAQNKWIHMAAVYDGSKMRLYKDGVEVGSVAKKGSITTNKASSTWLGGNPPNVKSRPWNGEIDYVGVYNHALTKEEIAEQTRE